MVVGDDVAELLSFCLSHLKGLSSAEQMTVFVVEHDYGLIKNLNDRHNFCFKVWELKSVQLLIPQNFEKDFLHNNVSKCSLIKLVDCLLG